MDGGGGEVSKNSESQLGTNKVAGAGTETLTTDDENQSAVAPIIPPYNQCIRPLVDAFEKLRVLNVTKEASQLPTTTTIVVVGDKSSGKSSVVESLTGINLHRDKGICTSTRVPLMICLHNQQEGAEAELSLHYKDKTLTTSEERVAQAIKDATKEIAGGGDEISDLPLKLLVKKSGFPDITLVDLPGIITVPVLPGKPKDIQIRDMVMKHIQPQDRIILNVCSAISDFAQCQSIQMSKLADSTGARTVGVVTMVDTDLQGFLEKFGADVGFPYIFVRNPTRNESQEAARREESEIFKAHPVLSTIDKKMVGIPVLAAKLVQTRAKGIANCLPEIMSIIKQMLNGNTKELQKLPMNLTSVDDAFSVYNSVIGSAKQSLSKILLTGVFDEYPRDNSMHFCARLVDWLNNFSDKLHKAIESGDFLMEEIQALKEHQKIELPGYFSKFAFMFILRMNIKKISDIPIKFFSDVFDSLEILILTVLDEHCENYTWLQLCACRGLQNLVEKMKDKCWNWVNELLEMEAVTDYTCLPNHKSDFHNLMAQQQDFIRHVFQKEEERPDSVLLGDLGTVSIGHLRNYSSDLLSQAFCLKMRMLAYWKIVLTRLVDSVASYLQYNLHKLVAKELEVEIRDEFLSSGGTKRMLEEGSPVIARKREKLTSSIKLLKDSKDVVASFMDRISAYSD